jgi:hypothetical protein
MAQRSDQIKEHIDQQRERLGSNVREIENRVKRTMDWRATFEKSPWMLIGAAAAGGLILSGLVGGASRGSESPLLEPKGSLTEDRLSSSPHIQRVSNTLDNIIGALVGLGTSKVKEFISDAVPGFAEHYRETERE